MDAREMLERHQWDGTAYGQYGSTARRCIECHGIHPDDNLHHGQGSYQHGTGHTPQCMLYRLLVFDGQSPRQMADEPDNARELY